MKHPALYCITALMLLLSLLIGLVIPLDVESYGSPITQSEAPALEAALAQRVTGHTALRSADVRLRALLGSRMLGHQAARGTSGRLYLAADLTDRQDASAAAAKYAAWQDAWGVPVVLLIVPDKADALSADLPGAVPSSCMTALAEACEEAGVAMVDTLSLLRDAPSLYYRTDSHWTAVGAGLAVNALLTQLGQPTWPDLAVNAGDTVGDLSLLAYPDQPAAEGSEVAALPKTWKTDRPMRTLMDMDIRTTGEGSLRLVVLRDSFGSAAFPWLAAACERLVYLRSEDALAQAVAEEKPQAVVVLMAERNAA